jgi:hypothetical protein
VTGERPALRGVMRVPGAEGAGPRPLRADGVVMVTPHKLRHDAEQLAWVLDRGLLPEAPYRRAQREFADLAGVGGDDVHDHKAMRNFGDGCASKAGSVAPCQGPAITLSHSPFIPPHHLPSNHHPESLSSPPYAESLRTRGGGDGVGPGHLAPQLPVPAADYPEVAALYGRPVHVPPNPSLPEVRRSETPGDGVGWVRKRSAVGLYDSQQKTRDSFVSSDGAGR